MTTVQRGINGPLLCRLNHFNSMLRHGWQLHFSASHGEMIHKELSVPCTFGILSVEIRNVLMIHREKGTISSFHISVMTLRASKRPPRLKIWSGSETQIKI